MNVFFSCFFVEPSSSSRAPPYSTPSHKDTPKYARYVEAYKACGGVALVDFEDVEVRRQTPDHTLWGAKAFALAKIDHEAVDDDDWRPDSDR